VYLAYAGLSDSAEVQAKGAATWTLHAARCAVSRQERSCNVKPDFEFVGPWKVFGSGMYRGVGDIGAAAQINRRCSITQSLTLQ
jgi:hypothetical protein